MVGMGRTAGSAGRERTRQLKPVAAAIDLLYINYAACDLARDRARHPMIFRQLFDSVSGTYSYLLASRAAARR